MNSENLVGMPSGNPIGPKNWKDLTMEEKLERTREQVSYGLQQIYSVRASVNLLKNQLMTHKHLDGEVVERMLGKIEGWGGQVSAHNPKQIQDGAVYF